LEFLPPELERGARRDFSGVVQVISLKSEVDMNRREGVTGLYVLTAMINLSYIPSKNSMDSPSFSRTTARFQSGLLPLNRPRVLIFPCVM